MTIDPRISAAFCIISAILLFTAGASTDLTAIFGATTGAMIVHVSVYLGGLLLAIGGALHLVPASVPTTTAEASKFALGPTAIPAGIQAAAKAAALFLAVLLGTLSFVQPGHAQTSPKKGLAVTGNPIADINTDLHGGTTAKPSVAGVALTGDITKDGPKIWASILAANSADLAYAAAMATAAATPASQTRLACIKAIIAVNNQTNGSALFASDGKTPLLKPDPHVVSDIESVAELVDNLSPQGALYTSCAGAATLFKTNVLALINGIVTGVAAFGATGGLIP